jgi:hypothetical protein
MSKISISIPLSFKERVEHFGQEDGVPLDAFIASVLSERMAVAEADSYIGKRASRGSAAKMRELLDRAPDVEPAEGDRITSTASQWPDDTPKGTGLLKFNPNYKLNPVCDCRSWI